jgi:putative holliday junction resolvase
MKYLGIDYGKRKMGLAVSEGQIASVFGVIKINSLEEALQKILNVIKKEEIARIVIGIPESGEARSVTNKFIQELKKRLKEVEIIEAEETLSSFQARSLMHDLHLSQSNINKKEDEYAASIILQNFLDSLQ